MTRGAGYRLDQGGSEIDRTQRLRFQFEGESLEGFAGDTLASARLTNGVRTVARSFKLHRRRGIRAEGWEDPNAFVQLIKPWDEPNLLATSTPLAEGLVARGMHGWPTIHFDLGRVADWLHGVLPAGFYYKTFKWPVRAWPWYESLIRRAAGLGRAPQHAGGPQVERRHAQADVLVVGAGPSGLSAAYHLRRLGHRVTIYEAGPMGGGMMRFGIPKYRLPREIVDAEVARIVNMGVEDFVRSDLQSDPRQDWKEVLEQEPDAGFGREGGHGVLLVGRR